MKNKQVTILRDRGQLTIPDSIRKTHPWLQTNMPISITTDSPNTITLTPYTPQKRVDLEKLQKFWENQDPTKDSVEFIRWDREYGHSY